MSEQPTNILNDYLRLMDIDQWISNSDKAVEVSDSAGTPLVPEMDWETLKRTVENCKKCDLYRTRTHAVFGVGNKDADLLIVGEAPGANEDKQGEPFVGRAGQLLNNMLKAIGLDRKNVYIANILKSRPPSNRDPSVEEVRACTPYLLRQITLIQPKAILALGRIAAQYLLDTARPMSQLRGEEFKYGPLNTPLLVTYHPAYLLRSPGEKRKSWQDLQQLHALLERLKQ